MQTKPFVTEGIKVEHMLAELRVKGEVVVRSVDKISAFVLRYGLVLVVFWIGCLKFTAYESKGVFNHASHSPLLAWAYHILDVRNFSRGLGVVEVATALLIAAGPVWPKLSIVGSLAGIGMFLTTLSFVITTPGVWQAGYGFPAILLRSEEHTSELQSPYDLVCRLLLEKKKLIKRKMTRMT